MGHSVSQSVRHFYNKNVPHFPKRYVVVHVVVVVVVVIVFVVVVTWVVNEQRRVDAAHMNKPKAMRTDLL